MPRRISPANGPDWPPEKTLAVLKGQLQKLQAFKGKTFLEVERDEHEWEQFTRSVYAHGFGGDSQNLKDHTLARSAGVHNLMGISDHQRQLNCRERLSQYESTLKSSIRELEASVTILDPLIPVPTPVQTLARPYSARKPADDNELLILISHSSKDEPLASALVEFLRAGLLTNKIRCSSVDGYRLPAGAQTDSQLRGEVASAPVLIGLITHNSLASAYVMFELGARWGAGSFMVPLLAGVSADEIRGPLSGLNALRADNDAQLHQLLTDVAKPLRIDVQNAASYVNQLSAIKTRASEIKPIAHLGPAVTTPAETKRSSLRKPPRHRQS